MIDIVGEVVRAHRAATPIIPVATADPYSTMLRIRDGLKVMRVSGTVDPSTPMGSWNCLQGVTAVPGFATSTASVTKVWSQASQNPVDAILVLGGSDVPPRTILFMWNLHRHMGTDHLQPNDVVQALQMVRGTLAARGISIILLSPFFPPFPPELEELSVIEEDLPGIEDIERRIDSLYTDLQKSLKLAGKPAAPELVSSLAGRAVSACRGLSALAIDQSVALSLSAEGLAVDRLWKRKIDWIRATSGMEVHLGKESLDDLGGLEQLKKVMRRLGGVKKRKSGVVVLLDEFEKQTMAIGGGDSTGVLDRMNSLLLQYMEQSQARGFILLGPAGTGKTHIARAVGGELEVPTVIVQLGNAMNKYVGESERQFSQLLKVISALGDYPLFIGACNTTGRITPELERRFRRGKFFLDLPTQEEKAVIWQKQLAVFDLPDQPLPDDTRWTGADIRNCCEKADDEGLTLVESAAEGDVPVGIRQAHVIDSLRGECAGKWRSASYPGMYNGSQDGPTLGMGGRLLDTTIPGGVGVS